VKPNLRIFALPGREGFDGCLLFPVRYGRCCRHPFGAYNVEVVDQHGQTAKVKLQNTAK